MSMLLLEKSEVDKAKSLDREREVQEGLKLAKRVDALRETVAQEEMSLSKFRVRTLSQLSEEITAEAKMRDELKTQVAELQYQRSLTLEPLTKELVEIAEGKNFLSELQQRLGDQQETQQEREEMIESGERALAMKEKHTSQLLEEADKRFGSAETLEQEAKSKETQAFVLLGKTEQLSSSKVADIIQREGWVKSREDVAFSKEEELRVKEIELAKQWSLLQDRQAILERNINRTKKK